MSLSRRNSKCSRPKIVCIAVSVLVLILVIIGLICLIVAAYSGEEVHLNPLEISPKPRRGSLIRVKISDEECIKEIVGEVDEFLKPYNVTRNSGCSDESDGDVGSCTGLAAFDPCTKENSYGYSDGTPCIFMKLRKDYDWLPQFYNLSHLPKHLPVELKDHIAEMTDEDKNSTQRIWIHCQGKQLVDPNDIGKIIYLPYRGFQGNIYPCASKNNCTEPLVAVFFDKPKTKLLINVKCSVFAKNLHEELEFKLLIE